MAYSSTEEYCATNAEIKVRPFLSRLERVRRILVRNSIGSEYRSFTPGVQGSSPCGPTWKHSLKAEQRLVKSMVECSTHSVSAKEVSTAKLECRGGL